MDKEKVYLTRDEGSSRIWIWRKSVKGPFSPQKVKDCDIVMYHRENRSLDNTDCYMVKDFKKKFNITIKQKIKKCCHLPIKLLNSEDYKQFSNDAERKQ